MISRICVVVLAVSLMMPTAHAQGIPGDVMRCIDRGPGPAACGGQPATEWWWSFFERNVVGEPRVISEFTERFVVDRDTVSYEWDGGECVPPEVPDVLAKEFMHTVKKKSMVSTSSTVGGGVGLDLSVASVANVKSNAHVTLNQTGSGEREDMLSNKTTVNVALCTRLDRTVECDVTTVTVIADVKTVVYYSVVCNPAFPVTIGVRRECSLGTITSKGVGYWNRKERDVVTRLRRCVRCEPW